MRYEFPFLAATTIHSAVGTKNILPWCQSGRENDESAAAYSIFFAFKKGASLMVFQKNLALTLEKRGKIKFSTVNRYFF